MAAQAIAAPPQQGELRAADVRRRGIVRVRDPGHTVAIGAIAAAASAVLYELASMQPWLWLCAIFAPLPILATAPELKTGRAAQFAFLAYFVGNLSAWGGESFAVPLLSLLASHLAGAMVFATFIACATEATRRWSGVLAAFVFPTLSTAFYYALAGVSPHGTWGSPAYSQVDFLPLLQTASSIGLCGVMFVMSMLPSGLAIAWYRRRWNMDWMPAAIMAVAIFVLAVIPGWIRLMRTPQMPAVRVGLVASDKLLSQFESEDVSDAANIVALYAKLVQQVVTEGHPQVVVLPEKVVGATPRYEWDIVQGFSRIAQMSHVWLVVGINQIGRKPKRNIAVVFDPDGKMVAAYAKHHLIPSLEFDYKPGLKPAIFDAPWGRTAVLICKDLDFPKTARELAQGGVRVVLAPAWDWPGSETIHQRMAVVRAVEAGFSLARAARQGMVSATDSRGREIAMAATSRTRDAVVSASLPLGTGPTAYSRNGEWFGQLCVTFAILLMLRLGVSIGYASLTRRRHGIGRRVAPTGVVSVEVGRSPTPAAAAPPPEPENEIYHAPTRPPAA
ncbi:MAG TPA: nitrilase-related carbon-nitrogen hydrolase [Candidatus Acidoferrales bacterium]|nr:nitrilase-related carbon-nitrogen hydrolase [Candidatus Acidoferrales bacterium]